MPAATACSRTTRITTSARGSASASACSAGSTPGSDRSTRGRGRRRPGPTGSARNRRATRPSPGPTYRRWSSSSPRSRNPISPPAARATSSQSASGSPADRCSTSSRPRILISNRRLPTSSRSPNWTRLATSCYRAPGDYSMHSQSSPRSWEDNLADEKLIREPKPRFAPWLMEPMKRNKSTYGKVAVAAVLINLFGLVTSLFTMTVYDRVVPNNATSSLIGLSIGLAIIVVFDFILKLLRAYFVDYAGAQIDLEVGERVFSRLLA